jgi:hypothetical protein
MSATAELIPVDRAEAAVELGRQFSRQRRYSRPSHKYGIEASNHASMEGWKPAREDQFSEEYLSKIYEIIARAFNLHVNNADIRGHNLGRTARTIGAGIDWKVTLIPDEVGMTPDDATKVCARLNRVRELHSMAGGFDASGRDRSEGILQVVAFLTHFIMGSCLIHRVGINESDRLLPLAIELIPGSRISTPYEFYSDPKVHFGVHYSDEYRSRVTGWHVKRVPKTIGNSVVAMPEWDFIPYEDGSFLELVEPAGVDRALPNCVAVTRLVFNRGQMFENCVEASRNHAAIHAVLKVGTGNFYDRAEDLADETTSSGNLIPEGWHEVDGVKERMIDAKDELEFRNAVTPGPDFVGVDGKYDERICRGLNGRLSEFTRSMNSSYSGGMQERQNDNPNVDQLRENFVDKWNRVHGWFLDACFLENAAPMPGYSRKTKVYWLQARKQPPAEIPLNPVDHRNSQKLALAMGQSDEYAEAEADGKDYEHILRAKAKAFKLRRQIEHDEKLPDGVLEASSDLPEIKTQPLDTIDSRETDEQPGKKAFKANRISQRLKAVRV